MEKSLKFKDNGCGKCSDVSGRKMDPLELNFSMIALPSPHKTKLDFLLV